MQQIISPSNNYNTKYAKLCKWLRKFCCFLKKLFQIERKKKKKKSCHHLHPCKNRLFRRKLSLKWKDINFIEHKSAFMNAWSFCKTSCEEEIKRRRNKTQKQQLSWIIFCHFILLQSLFRFSFILTSPESLSIRTAAIFLLIGATALVSVHGDA